MKSFFARVLAMHPFALLAAIFLLPPASAWLWLQVYHVGRPEQVLREELQKYLGPITTDLDRQLAGDPRSIHPEERRDLRTFLADRLQQPMDQVIGETANWRKDAGAKLDAVLGEVHQIEVDANDRTVDVLAVINGLKGKLDPALDHIASIAAKADEQTGPILINVSAASKELPGALRDGRFLLARSARTVGHIEQAADRIEAAVPHVLETADSIGANVQRATDESAKTAEQSRVFMAHLAEMTKPLPAWARIALAVAPPAVQTGFTVGSWLALKGKSK